MRGQALAAGIPEDHLPEIKLSDDFTPATYNDPELTERLVRVFRTCFGENNVIKRQPTMGGEDFSEYGRVDPKIPICMFVVGGVRADVFKRSQETGEALPSLHSPHWAPDPEPTIKTGMTAMIAAVLGLVSTHLAPFNRARVALAAVPGLASTHLPFAMTSQQYSFL